MSKRLSDLLSRFFPKKKEKTGEWTEPQPPPEEPKKAEKWTSAEAGRVPGHPRLKRALAALLTLLYAATMFLVPMDTYGAGLTLLTIYILLDYMMITR